MPSTPKQESSPSLGSGNSGQLCSASPSRQAELLTRYFSCTSRWQLDLVLWPCALSLRWILRSWSSNGYLPTHHTDTHTTQTHNTPWQPFNKSAPSVLSTSQDGQGCLLGALLHALSQTLLAPGHGWPLGPQQAAVREKKIFLYPSRFYWLV